MGETSREAIPVALPDLAPFLALDLSLEQRYGLAFLLGSFTVAALSDVRRMAAQREFLEVWVLAAVALLALDLARADWRFTTLTGVKWGLILLLAVLSTTRFGILFRLARADVAACTAAAALLPPLLIVVFWALLKTLALVLAPVLAKRDGSYPFLPVVTLATLAVLVIGKAVERVI